QEKMFVLSLKAKGQGTVSIQFLDEQQHILFSKTIKNTEVFEKKFNLDNLDLGTYTLKVEDELKVTTQPIEVSYEGIEVDYTVRQATFKPYVQLTADNKQLDINWLMQEKGAYRMNIYNDNTDLLYHDTIKEAWKINKRYDLAKLPKGNYYVTIKGGSQTHYHNFQIN
ncbi:MAG: hypothetical protein AAGD05_16885, partial [Bacteroidota bacterium]